MTENNNNRVSQLINVQNEALELFKKKNTDYGDAFADYGSIGVIVRIGDKIKRLISITNNQIKLVENESIRDTLIDLHNYSAMAIMLLDEKKSFTPLDI
jgi:predicted amino acid racemase